MSRPPAPAAVDLLAMAARILFVYGQTTESTRRAVVRLGTALRIRADLVLRWGEILLYTDDRAAPRIVRADPSGIDMRKVAGALDVLRKVELGRMDAAVALAALRSIEQEPPVSPIRFVCLAAAGAVALGVIFGLSDLATALVIALSAALGAWLRRGVARISVNPLIGPFLAALSAGIVGVLAVGMRPDLDLRLILVCPCMVLVPGPHLLNGTIDLAVARIPLGAARVTFAGLIVLMICSGLLTGLALAGLDLPAAGPGTSVPFISDVGAAGVAVAAFGTFFNMPWRVLPIPIGIGMLAHGTRWLLMGWGAGPATGALAASVVAGLAVTPLAARLKLPFAGFAFASVVSLVPGLYLFEAAAGLMGVIRQGGISPASLLVQAVADATTALLIVLGMTTGLVLPRLVMLRFFEPTQAEP
ncbi:MAG: threonine/serine exporter family protein [Microvirga sp.]